MNQQLEKLLQNPNNVIVWTIDGTLTEARWGKKDIALLHETPGRLVREHSEGRYLTYKPIPLMVDLVARLPGAQFVMSQASDSIEQRAKDEMMNRHFASVPQENRFYTRRGVDEKKTILHMLATQQYSEATVVFLSNSIDDLKTLNNYFRDEELYNIEFYHTSSLFV